MTTTLTLEQKIDAILAITKPVFDGMSICEIDGLVCLFSAEGDGFYRVINDDRVQAKIDKGISVATGTYEYKLRNIIAYYERKLAEKSGVPPEPEPDDLFTFKEALSKTPAP